MTNFNGKRCLVAIDCETHGKIAKLAQVEDRTFGAVVKRAVEVYDLEQAETTELPSQPIER